MISAEYDYNFLVTRELDNLVSDFVESIKKVWPSAVIIREKIREIHEHILIFRDKDMEQNWDWQVSTDTDFSGEGIITLQISPWGFQEMELLVKCHNTKSPDGYDIQDNYDSTLISKNLRTLSLCLPWDRDENEFCGRVYSLLKRCINNAANSNNALE